MLCVCVCVCVCWHHKQPLATHLQNVFPSRDGSHLQSAQRITAQGPPLMEVWGHQSALLHPNTPYRHVGISDRYKTARCDRASTAVFRKDTVTFTFCHFLICLFLSLPSWHVWISFSFSLWFSHLFFRTEKTTESPFFIWTYLRFISHHSFPKVWNTFFY